MKSLYIVYDFIGPNGFFYNSINTELLPLYFINDLVFNKETEDFILLRHGKKPSSCENIFFRDIQPIHISDISNFLLENRDNQFIYPISTGGHNETSLGIEENYHKSKTIFDFISTKSKKLLDNKNFNILINFGLEHEMPFKYFTEFYISLQNNNINPNKIWIISNNFKNYENNKKYLDRFGINNSKSLNFLTFYEQLRTKSNETLDNDKLFLSENDLIHKRKYKSLMLNRRLHLHRIIFLSLLANDNYLDNNLISFDINFDLFRFNDFKKRIENHGYINVDIMFKKKDYDISVFSESFKYNILRGYNKIKNIEKKVLDVDDLSSIDGRELEIDDINLYKNSYFSLVAETEFFERFGGSCTEKILKPIQQLHPFLLLGRPHTLRYLKSYGFKTFSEFWDESYDNEEVDSKRLIKVYDVFRELNEKTDENWIDMYKGLKDILIYNRNLLKSYSYKSDDIIYKNLIKYLENEHIQENTKLLQTP